MDRFLCIYNYIYLRYRVYINTLFTLHVAQRGVRYIRVIYTYSSIS